MSSLDVYAPLCLNRANDKGAKLHTHPYPLRLEVDFSAMTGFGRKAAVHTQDLVVDNE